MGQRGRKNVQQVLIKDRDGNVLTSEERVLRRWKEHFVELRNKENKRRRRVEEVGTVEKEDGKILHELGESEDARGLEEKCTGVNL